MITEQLGGGYSVAELKVNNSVSFTEEQCPDLSGIIVKGKTSTMKGIEAIIKPDVEESLPVTDFVKDNCFSLRNLENLVIPVGVTKIDEYSFENFKNLTSVEIPDSVTEIGRNAFSGCSNLSSIKLPNNLKVLGDYCFNECENLTTITIPGSVESWGAIYHGYNFRQCRNLTNVIIEEGVTTIGTCAFIDANGVTTVRIPESVTKIETQAFTGCCNKSEHYSQGIKFHVVYAGSEEQWNMISKGSYDPFPSDYTVTFEK